MMKCLSTSAPANAYSSPAYAKCTQTVGLASTNILDFSPSDAGQVVVSGETEFAALASKSPLYAAFAPYKCDCAAGFGWNPFRRRCYPIVLDYVI
jgi:hypothetical protein